MVLSAVMGIVCVGLIIFLYIFSGGWKTYGGITGIWRWLSQGGLSNPGQNKRRPIVRNAAPDATEVADVLEDIYREFTDSLYSQNEKLQTQLADTVMELQHVIQALDERVSRLEMTFETRKEEKVPKTDLVTVPESSQKKEPHDMSEPVYFQILDELRKGSSPEKVAARLHVSVDDVKSVLEIMIAPARRK